MKTKNTLLIIASFIFIVISILLFNFVTSDEDSTQDEYISEFEDELNFDDSYLEATTEGNTFLVSCDTTVRYWENINTEEQFTVEEITCDTMLLYCDTLNGSVVCDTLYLTNN